VRARARERERERERERKGESSERKSSGKPQAIIYLSHLYDRTTDPPAGRSFRARGFRCGGMPGAGRGARRG